MRGAGFIIRYHITIRLAAAHIRTLVLGQQATRQQVDGANLA